MQKVLKSRNIYILLIVASFAFYCWMAENIPYTHDDWDWGLPIGMEQFLTASLNSRYTGNLIELILTRFPMIKMLFMGLTFTSLPIVASELALLKHERHEKWLFRIVLFISFVFMTFCMPSNIWQQTYGWVAGFSNFVVSGFAVLIYLFILLKLSEYGSDSMKMTLLIFTGLSCVAFGLSIQLFLENVTVYIMLVSAAFPVVMLVNRKKVPKLFWCLFAGNLMGFVLMFSSSMYASLLNTGKAVGGYRQLTFEIGGSLLEIVSELWWQFFVNILPGLTTENALMCVFVSVLVFLALFFNKRTNEKDRIWIIICGIIDLAYVCYYVYLLRLISEIYVLPDPGLGTIIINMLFIVVISGQLMFAFGHDRNKALWYGFIWLSASMVLAPMVVINTIGPRSFFTSNIFFMLLCLMLISELWLHLSKYLRSVAGVALVLAVMYFGRYFFLVYSDIGSTSWEREEAIRAAVEGEATEVFLPCYNYAQYLWLPDPMVEERIMFFREFYSIPDNVPLWCESWERMYDPPEEWHLPGLYD